MMHLTLTYLRSQAYLLQTQVSSSQGDTNTLSAISPEYNIWFWFLQRHVHSFTNSIPRYSIVLFFFVSLGLR